TVATPCQFPIIGLVNDTQGYQMIQDYMPYISSISGGALNPNTFNITFSQLVVYSLSALPGQSSLPWFNLGWAPDYPDPTDYMAPMYYANATYTSGDALQQGLSRWDCSDLGPTNPETMQALLYWANEGPIPQACQGNAYAAMEWGMSTAAGMAVGPARVLLYNLVEHIANQLALYVYYDQKNVEVTYAAWIDPMSVNTNPMIGGGSDQTWYLWSYASSTSAVTLTETGLPSGTEWWVNLTNDRSFNTTTSTVSFTEPNGTYDYTVATTDKEYASAGGSFTVNGGVVSEAVTFSLVTYSATFTESGLTSGTTWYVNITGGQSYNSTGSTISFSEPNGTYDYTVATMDKEYSSAGGSFPVNGAAVAESVTFTLVTYTAYPVTFTES